MHEWSPDADGWQLQPDAGAIEDPALALPLPIEALVRAAKADDAMAAALLAKNNPVFAAAQQRVRAEGVKEGRKEGREQGREEGARQATAAMLFKLLAREFGSLSEADRRRVEQASLQQLQTFVDRALTASRIEDVLG